MSTVDEEVEAYNLPDFHYDLSGDAIAAEASRNINNPLQVLINVHSYSPVHIRPDEDGPEIAVTQMSPPSADDRPGYYSATHTYDAVGPHTITCWNNTCDVHVEIFAGEYPAWDPSRYKKTAVEVMMNERAKAGKIFSTKGLIG